MSHIDERCTCCGQWIPAPPLKRSRAKAEKLPPYPLEVPLSEERCTFCGEEAKGSLRVNNEIIYSCKICFTEFGLVLMTHLGITDRDERLRKVKAEVLRRRSESWFKQRGSDPEYPEILTDN